MFTFPDAFSCFPRRRTAVLAGALLFTGALGMLTGCGASSSIIPAAAASGGGTASGSDPANGAGSGSGTGSGTGSETGTGSGTGSGTGAGNGTGSSPVSAPSAPLAFPSGFMPSVKSYGAVGDGMTDDTAAIQAALGDGRSDTSQDYYGKPKALFFPAGTYLVHDTLRWTGCCVTLQGAGAGSTTIRLAPGSAGFGDPSAPKPLVLTPAGNQSFHQNIWDMAFSIGPGNPGATGLSYISNNTGALHNLAVTSEDGHGVAGIDLTRQYAGPLLVRNTQVTGFDAGFVLANAEYGVTMEAVTLQNQNVVGIRNTNQPLSIRGLTSANTVPAILNRGGLLVLLDANLSGGGNTNNAVQTDTSAYLRNVNTGGYAASVASTGAYAAQNTAANVNEQLVGAAQTLTGTANAGSLKLPVSETPSFTSTDLTDWAAFTAHSYGDTSGLQPALNSGKHTVYFQFGSYFSYNEADVTVPDTVDRIVGFSSVINGSSGGTNGGGIKFIVAGDSPDPLVIEQFGYGVKIDHRGSRPVVVKDARMDYASEPGAGDLFLEDVEALTLNFQTGQHVWARQLNDEVAGTKITNSGTAWILGIKTERGGTVINTQAGGKTELLGGLLYPAGSVNASDAAFRSTDAQTSYIYTESVYCSSCGYATQIDEVRSGVDQHLQANPGANFRMPLIVGWR